MPIFGYPLVGANQSGRIDYVIAINPLNTVTFGVSESGILQSAFIYASQTAPAFDLRAFVYKITGSDATSILIASSDIVGIVSTYPAFSWVELPFSGSIALEASTTYGLAFSQRKVSGTGGNVFKNDTATNSQRTFNDVDFTAPLDLTSFSIPTSTRWSVYASYSVPETATISSDAEITATPESTTVQSTASIFTADPSVFTYSDRIASNIPGLFVSRGAESIVADWTQYKLREPDLTAICTHLVNNVQYILTTCPRCVGTGAYHDVQFNGDGQMRQVFDEEKLGQDLEKIILTKLGENPFHTQYGFPQNVELKTRQVIELLRNKILENVSNIRQYQWLASKQSSENISVRELINTIDRIDIVEDATDPGKVFYKVYVRTVSADVVLVQGQINIP